MAEHMRRALRVALVGGVTLAASAGLIARHDRGPVAPAVAHAAVARDGGDDEATPTPMAGATTAPAATPTGGEGGDGDGPPGDGPDSGSGDRGQSDEGAVRDGQHGDGDISAAALAGEERNNVAPSAGAFIPLASPADGAPLAADR